MSFDVPILLLTWRRPETTRQVINAMRKLKPTRVFIASDGPRNPDEMLRVFKTRELIQSEINWECEIFSRYNEKNLGCRHGVSSALSWFFDHVDEGIILEDDCVPHEDFFLFCRELLDRYRDDQRIWCISGDNFQDGQWRGTKSYYFSKYNHCWGWATWKRCWSQYNDNLDNLEDFCHSGLLQSIYQDPVEQDYWRKIWFTLKEYNVPDSWAYRWTYTCISNGGMTALPNVNLVHNIGFGEDALHTKDQRLLTPEATDKIMPLSHPCFLVINSEADQYTFDHHFGGREIKASRRLDQVFFRYGKQAMKKTIAFILK